MSPDLSSPAELAALLERMQLRADPLADDAIERIVGPWPELPEGSPPEALEALVAGPVSRLRLASRLISQWHRNADLADWHCDDPAVPSAVVQALQDFLRQARQLPDWADPARIAQAEQLFFDYGPLSCALLFCASLPQCYVVPDLAEVLHTTGQLEDYTDHRIRATGAMIFPVMMAGGLTQPEGGGVAAVLKVRLIHATVRNLILRGHPQQVLQAFGMTARKASPASVRAVPVAPRGSDMHRALLARGWNLERDGLPCNQEDQAYTLLTFGFIMMRGMRALGQRLPRADEDACLHAWNVVGHLVGIEPALMAHDMDAATRLFELMQARGREEVIEPDPRPHLGRALMDNLARIIPLGLFKPFPLLLARRLCGPTVSQEIGLMQLSAPWPSRLLFAAGLGLALLLDHAIRRISPRFGLVRWLTRLLGVRVVAKLLMDETRPLALPVHLRDRLSDQLKAW